MRMIIVSGLSGSGKSIALQTLEDLNYYCVDNLPLQLLKPFAQTLLSHRGDSVQNSAVGVDARNFRDDLQHFPQLLEELRNSGLMVEVLFLHTHNEILIKRYSETRRRHPLSQEEGIPLVEAIRRERQLLDVVATRADLVIDTSHTNIYELRELVRNRLHDVPRGFLSILFQSFGFKHGIPADADFVFDVRALPNPHWEPQLRPLTGRDKRVAAFLGSQPAVLKMIADLEGFLESWIPSFEDGNRSYLTVAIGCTGGQHRSVYIAEVLAAHFARTRQHVKARHRELT